MKKILSEKVLVTGSKGFIGSHLVKRLGKENVIEYDIKTGNDVLDLDQLEWYFKHDNVGAIIHLAAISNRQDTDKYPNLAIKTNIEGTYNVLSVGKKYKVPVYIASSAATARPDLSLYGMTKMAVEHMARFFSDTSIVLRFYNVYGPGSKSVVNKFIKAAKSGKTITLNGNTRRDYVWVGDVVGFISDCLEHDHPTGIIIEMGTGVGTKLMDLYKLIFRLSGKVVPVRKDKPIQEIQESVMGDDDEADARSYGDTSLKEGIKALL